MVCKGSERYRRAPALRRSRPSQDILTNRCFLLFAGASDLGTGPNCNCNRRRSLFEDTILKPKIRANVKLLNPATSNTPQQQQRRQAQGLSDAGYQKAVAYGLKYLEEKAMEYEALPNFYTDLGYVGHKLTWIYYRENENLFSVLVTRQ
jgi:hypothetical protein